MPKNILTLKTVF